ncbi:MAG TPA: FkbM family methyltransferase [Acidobacteriaceae bacterium]|jgi:FkbM family methyltransferase
MTLNEFASKAVYKVVRKVSGNPDAGTVDQFLHKAKGLIHVGANTGQERKLYAQHGLKVVWVEPIPSVFATLQSNLAQFPDQVAFERLVADRDGAKYTLNIANNGGESSSILDLARHREIWPDVAFTGALELEAVTLSTLVREQAIDMNAYDGLVLDTQGSELLILKGAGDLLVQFRYVKCEVADFESYAGCCQLPELNAFMASKGFKQKCRTQCVGSTVAGTYYDVLYQRQ